MLFFFLNTSEVCFIVINPHGPSHRLQGKDCFFFQKLSLTLPHSSAKSNSGSKILSGCTCDSIYFRSSWHLTKRPGSVQSRFPSLEV